MSEKHTHRVEAVLVPVSEIAAKRPEPSDLKTRQELGELPESPASAEGDGK